MILKSIPETSGIFFITLFLSFSASFAQTCDPLTLDSISNPGEYTIGSLTEADGIRNGPDYNGATIYYPTNSAPPYSGMAIVPGYTAFQSSIQNWGPFLASHGIVTMTIGTNSIFEQPEARKDALLDALVTLKEENTRAGSPLLGQLDITSLAVGGWSMGGGGAQLAAVADPSIKAVMALCPWLETSTLTPVDINHAAPILIFSAENDVVAPPALHADVHYDYTPLSTSKMLFEIAGGGHQAANDPIGGGEYVGKIAVSWLKNFLVGDPCYCPLVLDTPPTASKYLLNVTCAATCNNSSVPTVTISPATGCDGSNATLTISGNLNNAMQWSVYTGSCGGTLVGTTSGSTIVVAPSAPNTTYFIRGEGGCVTPGSCGQVTIPITPLDDPSFNYPSASYCAIDANPVATLTGLLGGTFSIDNGGTISASTGELDLATSGAGVYVITYLTNGSCPNSATFNISISNSLDATIYAAGPFCENVASTILTAVDGGGTWSGTGITNTATGTFDPATAGPGTWTITYTLTGSCGDVDTEDITVNALDDPSFNYPSASYCFSDPDPTPGVTVTPGGEYTSAPAGLSINLTTGDINLLASTAGIAYTVTYTTLGVCLNSGTFGITVDAEEDPSFSYTSASFCQSDIDPLPTITGVTGGIFTTADPITLNGSTGEIDLSASTVGGPYTITYTTPGTCSTATAFIVNVIAEDDPSFSYAYASYCQVGVDPTPIITGLGSGVFSGSAGLVIDATGVIDLNVSGIGSYTVTYTTAGTCPASSNLDVSITTAPNATFSYTESPYCPIGIADATLSSGASAGVFSATPAGLVITPISGDIDLTTSTAGTYTVTNTIAASGSCAATSVNSTIVVLPALTGALSNTICNGESIFVNGTTYNATNPTGTEVFNNIGPNGCDSTVTINLNVLTALTGSVTNTVCNGDSIVVNGTTYNAVNSSGTEMFTNIGPNNCDSTVTVNITVQNVIDVSVTQTDETLTSNQNGADYKWLDCDNGNTMIPTETNQAYTATSNGNYAVEVTVGSCVATSSCISIITIEIIENTFRSSIQVYPNPTDGNFSLDLGESYKATTITLTDLNGKLIQSKDYNESQLLNLKLKQPAGIYLLIIESGNEKAVIRLVKE